MLYLLLGIAIGGALAWFLRSRVGQPQLPAAGGPSSPNDHTGNTLPPPPLGKRPDLAPASGPRPQQNVIEGLTGDVKDKTFVIGQRIVTLGRSPVNYVQTVDSSASRVHCQLRADAEGMWLTDMTTRNGTFVNEKRVKGRVKIDDGDLISVGSAIFRYRAGAVVLEDAALKPKVAGASSKLETAPAVGTKKALHGLVQAALRSKGGDIQEAAKALEIDVHTVVEILRLDDTDTGAS